MERVNDRYVWDQREGSYFLEWREGKRYRQLAGQTPSQATEAQRRKRNELIGEQATGGGRLRLALKLGIQIPQATVAKDMARQRERPNYICNDQPSSGAQRS
jgi:hypothetical protein